MSSIIEDLIARKIFNNRGEETIEVDVITASGFGRAAAPAGKSRGKAEVQYYPQGGVEAAIKLLKICPGTKIVLGAESVPPETLEQLAALGYHFPMLPAPFTREELHAVVFGNAEGEVLM